MKKNKVLELDLNFGNTFKYDIPAGIAVFFVAVPLCLGIAHASGAPLLSGLITGAIGGLIAGFLSNSHVSVSGPAAGLTAIALAGIAKLGSFEAFLVATFLAGLLQMIFGFARMGAIASYIPNTVIKGMLSAIGLILIIKQFPHMIGYDVEQMGVEEFAITNEDLNPGYHEEKSVESNSFTVFLHSLRYINVGVLSIGLTSLLFLIGWEKYFHKKFKTIPGSLLVVLWGVLLSYIYDHVVTNYPLLSDHFVNIPAISSFTEFRHITASPGFSSLTNINVYVTALTIAIVASIESLLSIEASDKIDPMKRKTNPNNELVAQGVGNTLAGLAGGLPMTSVIVRSSVNVAAGAQTKLSAIFHGGFIVIAVIFLAPILNMIPLASLAAVLIYTGYKLLNPASIKEQYKKGWSQLIPFLVTLSAIVLTDLLVGVIIGIIVSVAFIVAEGYRGTVLKVIDMGKRKRIVLGENITFLHKPKLSRVLAEIPEDSTLEIDGSHNFYIDKDIIELIREFDQTAPQKNIELILGGINIMNEPNHELKNSMNEAYNRLFKNNEKWVADKLNLDPNYFKNMAKGQTPQYLFIGCSDSRVPANEITGTEPGELFVHRNIANMVVNTDVNLMSVVQYSVEVLNVKHVIVCGHYGCGGVKAAMEDHSLGLIDKWLRNIKDVYRLHKEEVDAITDKEQQHRRMVELNVREQVYNLMKTGFIQKNRKMYGFPEVHGWVYDINDGRLIDMKIDVNKEYPEFNDVYKLY